LLLSSTSSSRNLCLELRFLETGLCNMVEAAGVEPASEKVYREKTTCVSGSLVFVRLLRNRQEGSGLARLISAFSSEQKLWTYPAT